MIYQDTKLDLAPTLQCDAVLNHKTPIFSGLFFCAQKQLTECDPSIGEDRDVWLADWLSDWLADWDPEADVETPYTGSSIYNNVCNRVIYLSVEPMIIIGD